MHLATCISRLAMVKTPEGAKVAVVIFVGFLIVAAAYWAGMMRVEDDLVRCTEDEVLVAGEYNDYTVNDLRCVHIEEVARMVAS